MTELQAYLITSPCSRAVEYAKFHTTILELCCLYCNLKVVVTAGMGRLKSYNTSCRRVRHTYTTTRLHNIHFKVTG